MQKQDNTNLLVWHSGGHPFAIELGECREIIQGTQVTQVPHTEDYVSGIANVRGAVLGIYDLPALLGYAGRRDAGNEFVIRVKARGGDFGIGADTIVDAVSVAREDIRAVPGNFSELESRYVKSLAVLPGRVALVVRSGAFDFG